MFRILISTTFLAATTVKGLQEAPWWLQRGQAPQIYPKQTIPTSTDSNRLGNIVLDYQPYTLMYKRGKVQNYIANFVESTSTTYFKTNGEAFRYYNASTISFEQEIENTDRILFSGFVDENVFFLVTQKDQGEDLVVNSYYSYEYSKKVTPRGSLPLKAVEGTSLEVYKIARFADTKIFYIFAKETTEDTKQVNWVFYRFHGFSNKILSTYRVPATKDDPEDYNTGEAIPSNIYNNYTHIYLVQGVQDPYLKKNVSLIHLRVTVINRNNPSTYFISKVFKLDFQEEVSMKGYQVASLGYFFPFDPNHNFQEFKYIQQYAAIVINRVPDYTNHMVLSLAKINITYNTNFSRLLVELQPQTPKRPSHLKACLPKLISQVGRSQVVALCRDPQNSTITIHSLDYNSITKSLARLPFSPFPPLKMAPDEEIARFAFVNICYESAQPSTQSLPMMLLKLVNEGNESQNTRVLTAPFRNGLGSFMNTKFEFEDKTDFLINSDSFYYFLVEDSDAGRVLSAGNLANRTFEIDLEKYTGNEYIEAFGVTRLRTFAPQRTKFKLELTEDIQGFWNSGLDGGNPPTVNLDKKERGVFKVDQETKIEGGRHFVISGNLDAPQRVVPDDSPSRLDIQFYTNSTVQNITTGALPRSLYLKNTLSGLDHTFLRVIQPSLKPSRRKVLEVLGNCSLTMESNFESVVCYQHYFQGLPRTTDPNHAYVGVVGSSMSKLLHKAGEIFELVGDRVVNIVGLSNKEGDNNKREIFGIQVSEWDKTKRNSSFMSDYSPPISEGYRSHFYITCNLTAPLETRNCTHYELKSKAVLDPANVSNIQFKDYHLSIRDKFDLNQIPEFANQHILKIGAISTMPHIFYITREFGAARSDIKLLTRFNYTKKIVTKAQSTSRIFRKIDQFELPVNLTDDMNFDICLGGSKLMFFVSPSPQTPQKDRFEPRVFVYVDMKFDSVSLFNGYYGRYHWKELHMDIFGFGSIRRLQCFDDYFAVIGEDKKTPEMTRLSVFGFYQLDLRYSDDQQLNENKNVVFGGSLDTLNLRRYDQVLDKAPAGLEYQIKFARISQNKQIVFDGAAILIFKSLYKPWYQDDSLLKGNPPDTSTESALARPSDEELVLEARALFHQSIYFLKGIIFQNDEPVNIKQTVVSTFGPKKLNFTNKVNFTFMATFTDKIQSFKSKLGDLPNKILLKNETYPLSNLVHVAGTVVSMEVYYSGGEVHNITSSKNWPLLTDKIYKTRNSLPNRNKIIRRFSTIVDFSATYPNRSKIITGNKTNQKSPQGSQMPPKPKQFTSRIYLNANPIPVDSITNNEAWENVDIYTGHYTANIASKQLSAVVFQSQYFNTTNDRYQTKLRASVFIGSEKQSYSSMDAYEAQFNLETYRKLYMRQENSTLVPYMFIYSITNTSTLSFIYTYKGSQNFTGFHLEAPGYFQTQYFFNQNNTFAIQGQKRFYVLGRGQEDTSHRPTLQKAEYDFNSSTWQMPGYTHPGRAPLVLSQVTRKILGMKCTQKTEFGDNAICLLYAGSEANYVVIYNPGSITGTPGPSITGFREIYIPPRTYSEDEDEGPYPNFDFNDNLIIKSIKNKRKEFQITYAEDGSKLKNPSTYSYDGFLVWDLSRASNQPIRLKYFTTHFTDFVLAGSDLIWTCSPQEEQSAEFNISLSTKITNQELQIPDVEYLRSHFAETSLRASFLNGTVIKVPFDEVFVLPPNNSFAYAYLVLGVIILAMVVLCIACKIRQKRLALASRVKLTRRKKTENIKKVKHFIPETQNESTLDQSKFRSAFRENTTLLTGTSQDVLL